MIDPKAAETRILEGLAAVLDSLCEACQPHTDNEEDVRKAIVATCKKSPTSRT